MAEKVRINKYLANLGVASRRKIDEFITAGRITLNGKVVPKQGVQVTPGKDKVTFDGISIAESNKRVYIIVNKPKGIISTADDQFNRKNVLDLVKSDQRLYPVGRLDENSTGLILLTNDGDLTYKLTHPKFHIPKTYNVLVRGLASAPVLEKLRTGIRVGGKVTSPAEVEVVEEKDNRTLIAITIHEGWYHQVRRMFYASGLDLLELKRVSIGSLMLGNLLVGRHRELTSEELSQLKSEANKS